MLSILMSGCFKDPDDDNGGVYDGERITINAHIPNSKSVVGEEHIQTVRMVVFNQDGKLVSNNLVENMVVVSEGISFSTQMARGINNVYIVCNETTELNAQLIAITKESDVEKITFQPAGITTPIPMYGRVIRAFVTANRDGSNVQVAVDGVVSSSLKIDIYRLLAKLNITIIKNIADANIDFTVDNIIVTVCRAPKNTPLKEGVIYTSKEWADNVSYQGEGTLENNGDYVVVADKYTLSDDIDRITFQDIYLPEHLLEHEEKENDATYLLIDMTYRMKNGNTTQMHSTYTVPIGQSPPANHNITRNHHYDLYATIKGLGSMGIYAEIVPFTEYHHPIEWKPFEGYIIVSERATEYGKNTNIWNDYSQYSGILKIVKDKIVSPAIFRYGSLTAVSDGISAIGFNALTDVLWRGNLPAISTWDEITYQSAGVIEHTLDAVKQGRGDPCRLVGLTLEEINNGVFDNGLWRMPTIDEMEWLNVARNNEVKTEGFYSFFSMITPKNGYRTEIGLMVPALTEGRYWSATDAKSFIFSTLNNTKVSSILDNSKNAYAVRCIRTTKYDSRFSIAGATVPWTGDANVKARIMDNYLVPFWRVIPVDPTAAGITYSVTEGDSKTFAVEAAVTQLPNPYEGRTFLLNAYGYGLDGIVHTSLIEINQAKLTHNITIDLTSTGLVFENGFLRIPREGATLKFKASLTPTLHPPYVLDNLKWKTIAYWYNNQGHTAQGSEALFSEESTVTFPPNDWGHVIGAEVSFAWVTQVDNRPPCSLYSKIRFIQEK